MRWVFLCAWLLATLLAARRVRLWHARGNALRARRAYRRFAVALIGGMLSGMGAQLYALAKDGLLTLQTALPLHLCSFSAVAAGVALAASSMGQDLGVQATAGVQGAGVQGFVNAQGAGAREAARASPAKSAGMQSTPATALIHTAITLPCTGKGHATAAWGQSTEERHAALTRTLSAWLWLLGAPCALLALLFPAILPTSRPLLTAAGFYQLHAALLCAPVFLRLAHGVRLPIHPRGVLLAGLALMACVAGFDRATGCNYLFLLRAPAGTPLSAMAARGPTAYAVSLAVAGMALLTALSGAYARAERWAQKRRPAREGRAAWGQPKAQSKARRRSAHRRPRARAEARRRAAYDPSEAPSEK